MKKSRVSSGLVPLTLLLMAGSVPVLAQGGSQAEAQRAAQAARAAQLEIESHTPKLAVTEEILPLRIPGHTLGETEGVSKNKAGHLFVYSRTGFGGSSRGGGAAKLFEWDPEPEIRQGVAAGFLWRLLRPCRAGGPGAECLGGG